MAQFAIDDEDGGELHQTEVVIRLLLPTDEQAAEGMRQNSESAVVESPSVGYPSSFIDMHGGGDDGLPVLPGGRDTGTGSRDGVGVPLVSLSPLPAHVQRAHGHALQLSAGSHRHRAARRALAAPIQTQPARSGGNVPHAGFTFTHETVREWEERFAPLLAARLRAKRRGKAGVRWQADETYIKVDGRWCYLSRAIDADGTLVDSMLSETRDMEAAKRFFAQALDVVGHAPEKVTTDGHDAYPRAIRETLGPQVRHRTSRYMNNRMEQDHRGVKQRYYPMGLRLL